METQDKLELIKKSDEWNHMYETAEKSFVTGNTTKEQYLAFKDYIKTRKCGADHFENVAYYAFKHRILRIDLEEYLDNEIIKCWKMLYTGQNAYLYGGGGDCMKYEAIPNFKRKVISIYNKFAKNNFEIVDNKIKLI